MLIKQTSDEAARSIKVQRECELQDISLVSCEVHRHVDLEQIEEPVAITLTFKGLGTVLNGSLRAIVEFTAMAQDTSASKELAFQITCRFRVAYLLSEGAAPTEEEVESFSNANAIFNCWPYAREFFQSTATRMNLHIPPLPFLRVGRVAERETPSAATDSGVPSRPAKPRPRRTKASGDK